MKKLIFLMAVVMVAISCERGVESVEVNTLKTDKYETKTATASDSTNTAQFEAEVDPSKIVPPRR